MIALYSSEEESIEEEIQTYNFFGPNKEFIEISVDFQLKKTIF